MAVLQRLSKVVIVGVGLIGGSFALGLKRAGAVERVVGVGRSRASLVRALELGLIDEIAESAAEAVVDADLVLLATPVAQTGRILREMLPALKPGTVVTDAGSTKSDVVAAAREVLGERIAQFVPGHPIAGRESNGPDAALADLYLGKKVVITALPENSMADVERVAMAWQLCGAVIHRLTPERHDAIFAAVSHLPHLLAFALVDDFAQRPDAEQLFQYAASGFRDFTRIAGSSPEMWRDVSLANRDALLSELDLYLERLQGLRTLLERNDGAALEASFARAREAREGWLAAIESAAKTLGKQ